MIGNAIPLDHALEVETTLPEGTRSILLKLGCTIVDKRHCSLLHFPEGTTWTLRHVAVNSHYRITLPDGKTLGAEYSRWLGLDGLYMIKIPLELMERYEGV